MKVLVPLAEGFEEIEGITIVDTLRRANIDVTTAAVANNPVVGSHGIPVTADKILDQIKNSEYDVIVLPGGMPGSQNLRESPKIIDLIRTINEKGGYVTAICAAPMVLGHAGVLRGKKATCFPGFESHLTGAEIINSPYVVDGKIITGRGPGCAIPFALKLVEILVGKEKALAIRDSMQVYWM